MDPLSMLIGAAILLIGIASGFALSRVLSPSARAETPRAICSCTHGLGQHDEVHGKCHGQVLRRNMRTGSGAWIGDQWVNCTCRHYDGPQPIEKYLATPTLPPRDGG
jgi:hypothetical protein